MTDKLDETDRRILRALQADSNRSQRELAEAVGLSQNALWRRLKQLEDENGKLRKLVADLSLDREMLQDVIRRKI